MDRKNLLQVFGSLFWLMAIFAFVGGQTWAVWAMTAAAIGWLAVWLTLPGAAKGALLGIIAAIIGR
ncbi:hypothetical protein [Pelomicrobium sp. G1]|uniref:hypothetical protein n=1 Tax=unclassified Pelomicrobium TaxID=2815318 RepID=UPI003F7621AC